MKRPVYCGDDADLEGMSESVRSRILNWKMDSGLC